MAKKAGRPTKLDDELQAQICKYIENGNTYERSCRMCDICDKTFANWRNWGKKQRKGKYFLFLQAIKKAREKFIAYHVSVINKATATNWQASAWMLERTQYKEFGRKDNHNISGTMSINASIKQMSDEELDKEIDRLKK